MTLERLHRWLGWQQVAGWFLLLVAWTAYLLTRSIVSAACFAIIAVCIAVGRYYRWRIERELQRR